jgi:DNA-binding MarR family transcriptional regulator
MRIQPDALVAGLPARQIRELLRQSDHFLSHHHVQEILGLNRKQSMHLLDRLEREGYIEKNSDAADYDTERYYKRTLKGGTLCKALFSRPVSRETAEKRLNEFMARVQQVNTDSYFLYRVRNVILFGSFLTDAPFVGDLDLAVGLEPKEPDRTKGVDMELARGEEAARNGRQFSNFLELLSFAEREVKLFLKGRSRIIQMTDLDDGILKIAKCRVIYEYGKN